MNRRKFMKCIAGILAAGVAPAAVSSNILMPIRPRIVLPDFLVRFVLPDGDLGMRSFSAFIRAAACAVERKVIRLTGDTYARVTTDGELLTDGVVIGRARRQHGGGLAAGAGWMRHGGRP